MASDFGKFKPLRLSTGANHFQDADSISLLPASGSTQIQEITDRAFIRTYDRDRVLIIGDAEVAAAGGLIRMNGTFSDNLDRVASMFALLGNNLGPSASYKLTLWDQATATVYETPVTPLADLIPLGLWAAGVDAYGGAILQQNSTPLIQYFSPVVFRSWMLEIFLPLSSPQDPTSFQLSTAFLGEYISPSHNFVHSGNQFQFQANPPELVQVESGRNRHRSSEIESKACSLNIARMDDNDTDLLQQHRRDHRSRTFMVIPYPEETKNVYAERSFAGIYSNVDGFAHNRYLNHATSIEFIES